MTAENAALFVAVMVLILGLRLVAAARKERQETREKIAHYLDETHRFLALFDSGAREEAKTVLLRLSDSLKHWGDLRYRR